MIPLKEKKKLLVVGVNVKYNRIEIGQKIGNLLILEKVAPLITKDKVRGQYKCSCDCNPDKIFLVTRDKLIRGRKLSCGCRRLLSNSNHKLWLGYGEISGTFFQRIKAGAKKRKIDFNLEIKDIWELFLKQNRQCALSGILLDFNNQDCTASLDRIDSSKDYTIDNVQWVHKHINTSKWAFDAQYYKNMCYCVINHSNVPHWSEVDMNRQEFLELNNFIE